MNPESPAVSTALDKLITARTKGEKLNKIKLNIHHLKPLQAGKDQTHPHVVLAG